MSVLQHTRPKDLCVFFFVKKDFDRSTGKGERKRRREVPCVIGFENLRETLFIFIDGS